LRTLPLPYSFITIVWCSFVNHSTASLLSSFTEISLPFILLIFLMKGEGGITVRMENSPKVLLEHSVCCYAGRRNSNRLLYYYQLISVKRISIGLQLLSSSSVFQSAAIPGWTL